MKENLEDEVGQRQAVAMIATCHDLRQVQKQFSDELVAGAHGARASVQACDLRYQTTRDLHSMVVFRC